MLFKRKFFLDLEAEAGKPPAPPAVVAPATKQPAAAAKAPAADKPAAAPQAAIPTAAAAPAPSAPQAPAAPQPSAPTTAEAIAAELAAEQANRPAPTQATFAPECLTPGTNPLRRRKAGADLARFRAMAGGMLRS